MYLKIRGLVLRCTEYNDRDVLLTILTQKHGKLTAKARGLKRKNAPLVAQCQLLAYSEFTLFEYRGMYTINEATSIELFYDLRKDLQKLSLGSYFAQAAELLCQEDIPNPELQSLVLNCLYGLSKLSIKEEKIKAVFELRAACIAGFFPDLTACCRCGNPWPDRFDLSEGRVECSQCRNQGSQGIRMPINASVLQAMRYITECDRQKIFSFELASDDQAQLNDLAESYLTTQLERGFSALDFYKSLLYT